MKKWLRILCQFQRTNLRGISMDLLIFAPDYFLVKWLCLQTKWYIWPFGISCLSQLLAHFQGLTSKPYAAIIFQSEQCKQNFLLGLPWLGTACLISSWLIGKSNKAIYTPTVPKKKPCLYIHHIQSKTHIHHFSLNINTSRSLSSSISPHFAFWWMGDGSHSKVFRVYPFWIFFDATPGWAREGPFIAFQRPCHIPVVRLWHQNMSTKAGCSQVSQLRGPLLNHLSR